MKAVIKEREQHLKGPSEMQPRGRKEQHAVRAAIRSAITVSTGEAELIFRILRAIPKGLEVPFPIIVGIHQHRVRVTAVVNGENRHGKFTFEATVYAPRNGVTEHRRE